MGYTFNAIANFLMKMAHFRYRFYVSKNIIIEYDMIATDFTSIHVVKERRSES